MTLGIFTTITNPIERGDLLLAPLKNYQALADKVVVVDGSKEPNMNLENSKLQVIHNRWPDEFSWEFIGQQFQRGYEALNTDWVIHADLDFIFHEKDFEAIRYACNDSDIAFSMVKRQFIQPDRFNVKSRLVLAINKKRYGGRIKFNSGGDLCQPSLDDKYLSPDLVRQTKIPFYNFEKLIKTEKQVKNDVERMSRAWTRRFKNNKLGSNDDEAYQLWLNMVIGRAKKPSEKIALENQPKCMQYILSHLSAKAFGYNGFSNFEKCSYL